LGIRRDLDGYSRVKFSGFVADIELHCLIAVVSDAEPAFPPALSRYTPCPTLNALRRLWLLEAKYMLPTLTNVA
jgi:hypothetical protein